MLGSSSKTSASSFLLLLFGKQSQSFGLSFPPFLILILFVVVIVVLLLILLVRALDVLVLWVIVVVVIVVSIRNGRFGWGFRTGEIELFEPILLGLFGWEYCGKRGLTFLRI